MLDVGIVPSFCPRRLKSDWAFGDQLSPVSPTYSSFSPSAVVISHAYT